MHSLNGKGFQNVGIIALNIAVIAKVAQLVEHDLAKVGVAGSNPVFRSNVTKVAFFCFKACARGEIGRHATLRG